MEVADGSPEWAIGFSDECWWSRVALPTLGAFSEEGEPRRMIQQSVAKDDPEPKAISCYGLYLPRLDGMWIRFVDGRPVSSVTPRSSFRGAARNSKSSARRFFCSFGTTPLGMSPKKSAGGSESTTGRSRTVEAKPG
jgi:hypothetical protein